MDSTRFMDRCLELARKGLGNVAPNPMVGAVIVHDDNIVGEGYHEAFGGEHAEINAIAAVSDKSILKESTIYISLEPCSHHGKTPPCADAIIQHGIPRVVIANYDPNPLVLGGGLKKLHEAGIEVESGVLADEAREMNKRFFTLHENQRPYIILKWAQSADGYIGRLDEEITISCEEARHLSHKWRTEEMAIMVGTNTARIDNPRLTPRLERGRPPLRLVLDRELKLPDNLHLFDGSTSTIVYTEKSHEPGNNLDYVRVPFDAGLLQAVLIHLEEAGVNSLLVEGGEQLLSSFIAQDLWDEARIITSPNNLDHGVSAPEATGKSIADETIGTDRLQVLRNLH